MGGLLIASAPGALAQGSYDTTPTVTRKPGMEHIRSTIGTALQLGGGVTNFSSQRTRDLTNVGGYWDVRAVMGTRAPLALEVAYVGNAQDIKAPGLDPNAALLGNGAEADLRLQAPLVTPAGLLVEPFVFGGGGWQHYSVVNDSTNTSVVHESNDVATVPFGAGIAMGWRGLMLDARFTYRETFNDNLFPVASESGRSDLQNWAAGLMIGYEM
jgi:hypothetical protein